MIYAIATLRVRPGSFAAHAAAAKVNIDATRQEEGCISYDLHQSVTDPDTYVFVERWTTRDALAKHAESAHLKTWRAIASTSWSNASSRSSIPRMSKSDSAKAFCSETAARAKT